MGKVNSKNENTDKSEVEITSNLNDLGLLENENQCISIIGETERDLLDGKRETDFKKECKLTLSEFEDERLPENSINTECKETSFGDNEAASTVNEEVVSRSPESCTTDIGRCVNSESVTYPVSEAEKMLQLYKKERALYHAGANMNKKDKIKHRPSPRYKTSNIHEVSGGRFCTPKKVESDMIVHPSTSVETTLHEGYTTTPIHDTEDMTGELCKTVDKWFPNRDITNLTKDIFEERCSYSKDTRLKPVGTGRLGQGKVSLWFELMEQGMVMPDQWSEVNCKQQEVMTELMSTGLIRKSNSENKYTMSIGAPRRRPPPRLNQIPPIERNKVEFNDLFSSKIPSIMREKGGEKNSIVKEESTKTNVIAVSEADENQKLLNISLVRERNKAVVPDLKEAEESSNYKRNYQFVDLLNSREEICTPTAKNSVQFVEKEIKTNILDAAERGSDKNKSEIANNNRVAEMEQKESDYFDALDGDRSSEIQRRKLRLWDIDTI